MGEFLFDEFRPISGKEWKQKIQVDLKGADYNKTLLSATNEGITIKPFYHQDDFDGLTVPKTHGTFIICQTIYVKDARTANFLAIDALSRGAESIKFIAKEAFDYKVLLHKLTASPNKHLKLYFQLQFLAHDFIVALMEFLQKEQVFLHIDLIGNLTQNADWFYSKDRDHEVLRSILLKAPKNIGVLGVDVSHYQNSGANMVQQIAYALCHANEYLNFLFTLYKNGDLPLSAIAQQVKNISFTFAIGGNYFFEIAKLRSFRVLWKLLLQEYDIQAAAHIFAEPSLRNKSIYDFHVNMLRTTTECMSAILGGANTISNRAYDAVFHKKNEFGERIARNQLTILREESNLKNSDFSEGSYYIEALTREMSEKALALFKDIEKSGGFVQQLFEGTIQRKIHESAQKEQQQFDAGEMVLLGVNKHPNKEDRMKDDLELYPFVKTNKRETKINPILAKRIAERAEQTRLTDE